MDTERISNMDALLFALALEVALLQIRILEGSTELRAQCWKLTKKCEKLQREKLARDRDTVKDVIRRTLIEVADNGVFLTLKKAVEALTQRASCAVSKRLQYKQLLASQDSIAEELEEKRIQWVTLLRDADHKTAILRDKINDDQLNANMRLEYAEKWVVARAESLELQYQQPRVPLPNTDHEQRVHIELLKAYEIQIKEREDSLASWEQRYATDIIDIKARVAAMDERHRAATLKHEELQKLVKYLLSLELDYELDIPASYVLDTTINFHFNLHEGEMRAWLTFKRERAARLAREERIRASATRIQAWWRGTMVRRGLGIFRFMRNLKKNPKKKK